MGSIKAGQAFWTPERIERLKELHAQKKSASQIMTILGAVSRNSVLGKMHRLGLSERLVRKPRNPNAAPKVRQPRQPRLHFALRQPASCEPVPPSLPQAEEWTGPALPFLDVLISGGCKFAVSPHDATEHLFCGAPRYEDRPYCPRHCLVAFNYETRRASAKSLTRMVTNLEGSGLNRMAANLERLAS